MLFGDYTLYTEKTISVTVAAILRNPTAWHGTRFTDPIAYGINAGNKRLVYADLSDQGNPRLVCKEGNAAEYGLRSELAEITIISGEQARVIDEIISIVQLTDDFYRRGGELVRVVSGQICVVNALWLMDYLSRCIRFLRPMKDGSLRHIDISRKLCDLVLVKVWELEVPPLRGVITAPTMRRDGTLVQKPGYDAQTALYLVAHGGPRIRNIKFSTRRLREAFAELWAPFSEFPFVSAHDRGVMLAAIFTAIVRRSLPSAPAFSFDAPSAASGKTLLASCLCVLSGQQPAPLPECGSDEEQRKRLLAVLREGAPVIFLDNIRGEFSSSALEAFLTSAEFKDRLLGQTEMLTFPTDVLVLISGNNFLPKGDLYRRILTARIDAGTDSPERRAFRIDPLEYCRENRQGMVGAALMLMGAYLKAGKRRMTRDRLASYEAWDDIVRQAVIWMGAEGIADVADPTHCIHVAKTREPERRQLGQFLVEAWELFGDGRWRVRDLIVLANTDLRGILAEIAGQHGEINALRLGRWIEHRCDVRVDGLVLQRAGEERRSALWRVSPSLNQT